MPQAGRTKTPGKSRPGYTSTESMRGGGGRPLASCGTPGPSTPWTWCAEKTSVTHTPKLENANIVNIVNKEFSKEMGKYKAFYEASQVSMSSINPAATNPTLTSEHLCYSGHFLCHDHDQCVPYRDVCRGVAWRRCSTVGKHSDVRLTLQPGPVVTPDTCIHT